MAVAGLERCAFCCPSRYLLMRSTYFDFDLLRHITAGIILYTARKGRYELNKVRIIQKLATSGI